MNTVRPQMSVVTGVAGSPLTAPLTAGVPLVPAASGASGAVVTMGDLIHPAMLPPLTIDAAREALAFHPMPTTTPWTLPFAQKITVLKSAFDSLGAQLDLIAALLGAVTLHADELRAAAATYSRDFMGWISQWPGRFDPAERVLPLMKSSAGQCGGVDFLVPLAITRAAAGNVSRAEALHTMYPRQEREHSSGLRYVIDRPRYEFGGLLVDEMGPTDAHSAGDGYRFRLEGAPGRTGMDAARWAHPLDPATNVHLAAALHLLDWELHVDADSAGHHGHLRYLGREPRPFVYCLPA